LTKATGTLSLLFKNTLVIPSGNVKFDGINYLSLLIPHIASFRVQTYFSFFTFLTPAGANLQTGS
jgi:hypothetical protein